MLYLKSFGCDSIRRVVRLRSSKIHKPPLDGVDSRGQFAAERLIRSQWNQKQSCRAHHGPLIGIKFKRLTVNVEARAVLDAGGHVGQRRVDGVADDQSVVVPPSRRQTPHARRNVAIHGHLSQNEKL